MSTSSFVHKYSQVNTIICKKQFLPPLRERMAKEILGWSKPIPRLVSLIHQQQTVLSSYPSYFFSCKRELLQRRVKRKAMASVNHEAMSTVNRENQSIGDDNSSEKPVTYKVNALVNVRYDSTEDVKEMMLHLFDAFSNSTQWALILQLLSTEIDPSKLFTFLI